MLAILAALCTCLLGLGLARFAYTPMIPALIAAHWFTPAQAVYLGAGNIAGYLAGAVSARAAAARIGVRLVLRLCLVAVTAGFFACAQPAGFAWFLAWRLLSGLAGAGLMVLAAPLVLPLVAPRHRGLAGGVIFTGIGIGIVLSGTLLPLLLRGGLVRAWLALGWGGLAATAVAWFFLPPDPVVPDPGAPDPVAPDPGAPDPGAAARPARALRPAMAGDLAWLYVAYGISATGQVPVILFLSDFVARGLHWGVSGGATIWAVAGAGALIGPLAAGWLGDRIGHMPALLGLWFSQIAANVALAVMAWIGHGPAVLLGAAAAALGAGIPALVALVLGRSQILAGEAAEDRTLAWSRATLSYGIGQVVGAYAMSAMFSWAPRYDLIFGLSALCMAAGLCIGARSRRAEGVCIAAGPA